MSRVHENLTYQGDRGPVYCDHGVPVEAGCPGCDKPETSIFDDILAIKELADKIKETK